MILATCYLSYKLNLNKVNNNELQRLDEFKP